LLAGLLKGVQKAAPPKLGVTLGPSRVGRFILVRSTPETDEASLDVEYPYLHARRSHVYAGEQLNHRILPFNLACVILSSIRQRSPRCLARWLQPIQGFPEERGGPVRRWSEGS
jgi:hypothetical protein